jgi:hypothetical protein
MIWSEWNDGLRKIIRTWKWGHEAEQGNQIIVVAMKISTLFQHASDIHAELCIHCKLPTITPVSTVESTAVMYE